MKLALAAAAFAATFALGSAAFAEGPAAATLEKPVPAKVRLIAGSSVWVCAGATCASGRTSEDITAPETCAALAKQVGPLVAYKDERTALQPTALEKCNAAAPKTTVAAAH